MKSNIFSRISLLVVVVFAAGLLLPTLAMAGPRKHRPAVKKRTATKKGAVKRGAAKKGGSKKKVAPGKFKKVTRYGFKNDTVEATADQGNGSLVTAARRPGHSSLLTVRSNFLPELIKLAEDL